VIAAIDMRGELRLVLAAQTGGDQDGEAAEDDAFGVFFTSAGFSERVVFIGMSFWSSEQARLMTGTRRNVKGLPVWYYDTA